MSQVRELLNELQQLWLAAGAPVQDLAPGASATQLDDAEASLGFRLSHEVRDWFTWSNGYLRPTSPPPSGRGWFSWPNMFDAISVQDMIRDYQTRQQEAEADRNTHLEPYPEYEPAWISFTRPSKYRLIADCTAARENREAPSGLHYIDDMEPEDWHRVAVPSISELLQTWLRLTQQNAIWFNSDRQEWDCRYDATAHGYAWAATVLPEADPMLPRI
ncbi:SMI1/KNR4 family protein [Kineosporia babensis]|uniref:SMI1/KNR4 family protein n=1 Tax=Kineosporia babensis TaxID=499548 RepID=A0A9X1NGT1_9ACTN|nr:SMI1/KNR4 family protein [Kineosporia babensis]MCD5314767.1 SMI1/KNR4 family protein [Kineosporia babensis]